MQLQYRRIERTLTRQDLLDRIYEWTREGATLHETSHDTQGNLTRAVLIDHGQRIHAVYTVGAVSDPPARYISKEEQERKALIDSAYALAREVPAIQITEIHQQMDLSCWSVTIPAWQWTPNLPYGGYCYTPSQLFYAVEAAVQFVYQHRP